MVSQDTLRLVKPEDSDVIPLERRTETRYAISGRVTALETQVDDSHETRNRICPLQLINISEGGLGAVSSDPVSLGTRISVFFPPHGPERGFDLFGKVVRCIQREAGHEIGVQFDARQMAA